MPGFVPQDLDVAKTAMVDPVGGRIFKPITGGCCWVYRKETTVITDENGEKQEVQEEVAIKTEDCGSKYCTTSDNYNLYESSKDRQSDE